MQLTTEGRSAGYTRGAASGHLDYMLLGRDKRRETFPLFRKTCIAMKADGSFLELSGPSTSAGSCAGQVRPINTAFYIPAGERK